ncbi:MAG: bifunctional (p)ppGpp synthetase/guanosine-3',5'-bis(diphosphate) 3'-pyrophosphohydrolase [Sandaracinaceae bacterium]|nr:bifunctional (p)ppGpp synthetase/guanosine-3',5'-bis(diphosphate) 3'-pyrophosphohydrolase [Sandaracinaceae bacterium]
MAETASTVTTSHDGAIDAIASRLTEHYPDADTSVIRAAYDLLRREDGAIVRAGVETAEVLARLRLDPPAIAAGLLARLATREAGGREPLRDGLDAEVATLLDGVQRLTAIRWDRLEEEAAESLRKMFVAMAQDVRVVVVVLAMRVQAIRALQESGLQIEERRRFARETLEVFAPLANRLGIWQLKWELEDGAFRELEPAAYDEIARLLAERREEREAFIDEVVSALRAKLAEEGIRADVKGRPKHLYSIYKKMQRKDLELSQLYDVMAVRVITERVQDCYAALGLVHSLWVPIPSELDDYIAKPKDNGYQSLHTAVIGPRGRPFEVQIRTREMHRFAELGVAAHWAYKEQRSGKSVATDKFMLLRQLMDWERDVSDPHQFVQSLKTDLFEDQVYVFTPGGDVVDLPVGSTPLDFAYRVHSSIGHRCRGARVNDHIVPLDTPLQTGDRVEILTHKEPQPSRDWMNPSLGFLRTASARAKVRQWFRRQGRDEAIAQGRDMVERELARLDLKHATLADVAAALRYPGLEELYAAVGYGDRSTHSVASAALSIELEKAPPPPPPMEEPAPAPSKQVARGVRINRVDEVVGRRARCCNPVPGDDVVGFVTRGRGIAVHLRRCPHVSSTSEPERLVEIDWGSDGSEVHGVELEIRAHDRAGLMGELSKVVSAVGVNITSARAEGAAAAARGSA